MEDCEYCKNKNCVVVGCRRKVCTKCDYKEHWQEKDDIIENSKVQYHNIGPIWFEEKIGLKYCIGYIVLLMLVILLYILLYMIIFFK